MREKALRDERSRLMAAERKGLFVGKRQTAVNMLRAGMSLELVAKMKELSLDEVEKLL